MSGIVEFYKDLMNRGHPQTSKWFLISSPVPVLIIVASYVYFSTSLGPRLMRDRKPFTLRNTLIIYNLIQVLLSIYLVQEGLLAGWLTDYSWKCQPVDYSGSPQSMRMARGVYAYFVCKLIELLDTVFFVLRKKQRQISFLHVYHHGMMPVCAWIGLYFVPGGHGTLLGVINSFIHILMYTYYMLAAFGPEMQKYLWWKKYLTSLQLVQFSIILVHTLQIFVRDCNYPKFLASLLCVNASLFIYLFGSFYIENYNKKSSKKIAADAKMNGEIANGKIKSEHPADGVIANGHSKQNGKTD